MSVLIPVGVHVRMAFLITSIAIVLITTGGRAVVLILMLVFSIIYKGFLCLLLLIHVHKALVVDTQLELVSMLNYVQHVVANLEGVLEGSAKFLTLVEKNSVLDDFLLACEVTANHLNSVKHRVCAKLPDELTLGPWRLKSIYFLMRAPMSLRSIKIALTAPDILLI